MPRIKKRPSRNWEIRVVPERLVPCAHYCPAPRAANRCLLTFRHARSTSSSTPEPSSQSSKVSDVKRGENRTTDVKVPQRKRPRRVASSASTGGSSRAPGLGPSVEIGSIRFSIDDAAGLGPWQEIMSKAEADAGSPRRLPFPRVAKWIPTLPDTHIVAQIADPDTTLILKLHGLPPLKDHAYLATFLNKFITHIDVKNWPSLGSCGDGVVRLCRPEVTIHNTTFGPGQPKMEPAIYCRLLETLWCPQKARAYLGGADSPAGSDKHEAVATVFSALKRHRAKHAVEALDTKQNPSLQIQLYPFQLKSVKFLRDREAAALGTTGPSSTESSPTPNLTWESKQCARWTGSLPRPTTDAKTVWLNRCSGAMAWAAPPPLVPPPGGILAEEMGLGKTVEMLDLICTNKRPALECTAPPVPLTRVDAQDDPTACCGVCLVSAVNEKRGRSWVACDFCGTWVHADCVSLIVSDARVPPTSARAAAGLSHMSAHDGGQFCCPFCWRLRCEPESGGSPVRAKTTLIITPTTILEQWGREIETRLEPGALSILRYPGLKGSNGRYIPPDVIAKYDVVLTSYAALRGEFYRAGGTGSERGGLRAGRKRYRAAPSPLMDVEFWRVVLDEAQMVQGTTALVAKMARKVRSRLRWAVSGTPINRSLDDLWGLLVFIGAQPYATSRSLWRRDVADRLGDPRTRDEAMSRLTRYVGPIFMRHTKAEVKDQIKIPPQTEHVVPVEFTEFEHYSYRRLGRLCSDKAMTELRKLGYIGREYGADDTVIAPPDASRLLASLLALRQACCHPMLGNRVSRALVRDSQSVASLQRRKLGSLADVQRYLVQAEQNECTDMVRERVVSIHGLAAIAGIKGQWQVAADLYVETVKIAAEFVLRRVSAGKTDRAKPAVDKTNKSMVDKTLRIHATHHLRQILQAHPEVSLPVPLQDPNLVVEFEADDKDRVQRREGEGRTREQAIRELRAEEERLRENCERKTRLELAQSRHDAKDRIQASDTAWKTGDWEAIGKTDPWWVGAVAAMGRDTGAGGRWQRFRSRMSDVRSSLSKGPTLFDRVRNPDGLLLVIQSGLQELLKKRTEALEKLTANHNETPTQAEILEVGNCRVCSESMERKGDRCRYCDAEVVFQHYESLVFRTVRSVAAGFGSAARDMIEGVQRSDGQEEGELLLLLRILHTVTPAHQRGRGSAVEWIDAVKREYFTMGAWMELQRQHIQSLDELEQCLIKVRLRAPDEEVNRANEVFVLPSILAADIKAAEYQANRQDKERKSRVKLGQIRFLQKSARSALEGGCSCCHEPKSDVSKVIFTCGHHVCFECGQALIKLKRRNCVECPMCRRRVPEDQLRVVDPRDAKTAEENLIPLAPSDGKSATKPWQPTHGLHSDTLNQFGAKLHAVVRLLASEPRTKTVVFSQWKDVISLLTRALELNDIQFENPEGSRGFDRAISRFKSACGPCVLLLQLKRGSAGLNLTEATRVVFVDPSLDPAQLLQAKGRIHRAGQLRRTSVHWIVMRNSIEENIYRLHRRRVQSAGQWVSAKSKETDGLTVGDFKALIKTPEIG